MKNPARPGAVDDVFRPPSIEFAKRKAKALAKYLSTSASRAQRKLSAIQQAVARVYRFEDWFSLEQQIARPGYQPSVMDDDLTSTQVKDRLADQAEIIGSELDLSSRTAEGAAEHVRLTGSAATLPREQTGRRPIQWEAEGEDPGTGDFFFTVNVGRWGRRGASQNQDSLGSLAHYADATPIYLITGGYEHSDRYYGWFCEQAPSAQQIGQVLTAIKASLGSRLHTLVTSQSAAKQFPVIEAARGLQLSVEHRNGRAAARVIEHLDSFLGTLDTDCRMLLETFPREPELKRLFTATGGIIIGVRHTHDQTKPYWLGMNVYAGQIAEQLCVLRGRDPEAGKRAAERAPKGAQRNSPIGPAPAPDSIALAAASAQHFWWNSKVGEDVEENARLLERYVAAPAHLKASELDTLSRTLGDKTFDSIHFTREGYIRANFAAKQLADALGTGSSHQGVVRQAMGLYLARPRRPPGINKGVFLFSLCCRLEPTNTTDGSMLWGIPDHPKVERLLLAAAGGHSNPLERSVLVLAPMFVSDYYRQPRWEEHIEWLARVALQRGPHGWLRAGQGPVARKTLTTNKINVVTPDRDLHLMGAMLSDGSTPLWHNRSDLAVALATSSSEVNRTLTRWNIPWRVQFLDLYRYGEDCETSVSILNQLPAVRGH